MRHVVASRLDARQCDKNIFLSLGCVFPVVCIHRVSRIGELSVLGAANRGRSETGKFHGSSGGFFASLIAALMPGEDPAEKRFSALLRVN
jgi:hypothetical protein